MTTAETDPRQLTLVELRALRSRLQDEDDAVSYARRVAQARLDLVQLELARRRSPAEADDVSARLREVLAQQLTGGPARPPRPTEDLSDHPLAAELEALCTQHHFGRLESLDEAELTSLSAAIAEFEQRVSADRRSRFERLDELSAELVRRYRDGEADVYSLLAD
jgi:hypothetical protein